MGAAYGTAAKKASAFCRHFPPPKAAAPIRALFHFWQRAPSCGCAIEDAAAPLRVNSTSHASTCAQLWALGMGRCLKRSRSSMATTLHTLQRVLDCGRTRKEAGQSPLPCYRNWFSVRATSYRRGGRRRCRERRRDRSHRSGRCLQGLSRS